MVGRGQDSVKRYDLGIKAMEYIIKEIPDCKMNIVSSESKNLSDLISSIKLENNINITGYRTNVKSYFKNASLHILSSISESYSIVLAEAKIFGIPSILCGLDYLALSKMGTVIIYDDNPHTLAKEAIKILINEKYRKKLGKEARESMKKKKNIFIAKKWVKILLAVNNDDDISFKKLSNEKIPKNQAEKILHKQLKILHKRIPIFKNLTYEKFINYSFT